MFVCFTMMWWRWPFYHTSEMFYTKLFWRKPAAEQVSINRFRTILKAFQNHFKCACECAELLSCGHAKGVLCHAYTDVDSLLASLRGSTAIEPSSCTAHNVALFLISHVVMSLCNIVCVCAHGLCVCDTILCIILYSPWEACEVEFKHDTEIASDRQEVPATTCGGECCVSLEGCQSQRKPKNNYYIKTYGAQPKGEEKDENKNTVVLQCGGIQCTFKVMVYRIMA